MHHHSTAGANLGALLNLIGDAWVTFCEFSGGADSAEMTEAGIRCMAEEVSSVWDDERVDLPALVMLVEDRCTSLSATAIAPKTPTAPWKASRQSPA